MVGIKVDKTWDERAAGGAYKRPNFPTIVSSSSYSVGSVSQVNRSIAGRVISVRPVNIAGQSGAGGLVGMGPVQRPALRLAAALGQMLSELLGGRGGRNC